MWILQAILDCVSGKRVFAALVLRPDISAVELYQTLGSVGGVGVPRYSSFLDSGDGTEHGIAEEVTGKIVEAPKLTESNLGTRLCGQDPLRSRRIQGTAGNPPTPGPVSASGQSPSLPAIGDFQEDDKPFASGGFRDIWKGRVGAELVCVKIVRAYRRFLVMREAIIWRQLDHPNLLPFHALYRQGHRIRLVPPWLEKGTLTHFLRESSDPTLNHEDPVWDIVSGFSHLHERKIVHADLKVPCMTDFGLSRLGNAFFKSRISGIHRWTAPEVLRTGSQYTYHSDICAFGCSSPPLP
ncbi:hypothetical protein WG66_002168 [Moniliophthora roreri]|nr:hypothetical protein WG66_002168 [Moniliophthora roreri]